jgi:hypothetical protein
MPEHLMERRREMCVGGIIAQGDTVGGAGGSMLGTPDVVNRNRSTTTTISRFQVQNGTWRSD